MLTKRKKRLERLIPASVGALNRVPCFEADGRELFEAACRLDLEGIVAKRKADPYTGEVPWYKIKNPAYTQAEEGESCLSGADEHARTSVNTLLLIPMPPLSPARKCL
jgi:ATP-dependent DNA ligase